MTKPRIVVLGAGFAGLELTTVLSESLGAELDLTLIDRADSFVFGFSKLDVLFGHRTPESVRHAYRGLDRPGVKFRQESVVSIDPRQRLVMTDRGRYAADYLVIALGADYDLAATPGLREGGFEFYSVDGAARAHTALTGFQGGKIIVGVASAPYKCPPAPSETVLLLDELLTRRGIRSDAEISLVTPLPQPIPPSPGASKALLAAFAERQIRFVPERGIRSLDPARKHVILSEGEELPYDLFLGVPHHRVPDAVQQSGLAHDGWVTVDPATMATPFSQVYAVGDLADIEVPKAGVFAEGAARVAAGQILADLTGSPRPPPYDGAASCYVEFGRGAVGRVDVAFRIDAAPAGSFVGPSRDLAREKQAFAETRRARWHIGR